MARTVFHKIGCDRNLFRTSCNKDARLPDTRLQFFYLDSILSRTFSIYIPPFYNLGFTILFLENPSPALHRHHSLPLPLK